MHCELVSVKSHKLEQSGEQGWGGTLGTPRLCWRGHRGAAPLLGCGAGTSGTLLGQGCRKGLAAGQLGDIKLRGYYLKCSA